MKKQWGLVMPVFALRYAPGSTKGTVDRAAKGQHTCRHDSPKLSRPAAFARGAEDWKSHVPLVPRVYCKEVVVAPAPAPTTMVRISRVECVAERDASECRRADGQ
jgi:hypothetical protein